MVFMIIIQKLFYQTLHHSTGHTYDDTNKHGYEHDKIRAHKNFHDIPMIFCIAKQFLKNSYRYFFYCFVYFTKIRIHADSVR